MERFICEKSELEINKPYVKDLNGFEVGVVLVKDEVLAFENQCPHAGGPVCLGDVFGAVKVELDDEKRMLKEYVCDDEFRLVCPWHGFEFEVQSGVCISDDAYKLLKLDVSVREGKVYVNIP